MAKRVAVIFRGIAYLDAYKHWKPGKPSYAIDFRQSYPNIRELLLTPLSASFDEVDVYCCTYAHARWQEMVDAFAPAGTMELAGPPCPGDVRGGYVLRSFQEALARFELSGYHAIIVTRFDVNLRVPFDAIPWKPGKVNFTCRAKGGNVLKTYNDDTLIMIDDCPRNLSFFRNAVDRLITAGVPLAHHLLYEALGDEVAAFVVDDGPSRAYEISEERPFCVFNREITYAKPGNVVLQFGVGDDMLPFVPYAYGDVTVTKLLTGFELKSSETVVEFAIKLEYAWDYYGQPNVDLLWSLDASSMDDDLWLQTTHDKLRWPVRRDLGRVTVRGSLPSSRNAKRRSIAFKVEGGGAVRLHDFQIYKVDRKPKIHFVSFSTEGPPRDRCLDMTVSRNRYDSAIRPHVDSVKFYTVAELESNEESAQYVRPFLDAVPSPYNPGVHLIGFLQWKPYVILRHLRDVAQDGDVVYYRDANVIKYPAILDGVADTRDLVDLVLSEEDVFVPIENYPELHMKQHVKRQVFDALDAYGERDFMEALMFNSSIVICRKTDSSIRLMREWLKVCASTPDIMLYQPTPPPQHPDFRWNVQEQSVLNVVLKKHWMRPQTRLFSIFNRSFTLGTLRRVPKVAVLLVGEMRNFDDSGLLKQNNRCLIDALDCDVFVSTWDLRGFSFNHGKYHLSETLNSRDPVSEDAIRSVYPTLKGCRVENFDAWLRALPPGVRAAYEAGFCNGQDRCPATAYPQLYKIWDADRLRRKHELEMGFKYDVVIKSRPDFCFVDPIPAPYFTDACLDDASAQIFDMNPPGIPWPNRVYDIFFYGNSTAMTAVCRAWENMQELIDDPFDNKLDKVAACRLLYVQAAVKSGVSVVHIPASFGDVYRNEGLDRFTDRVRRVFNANALHFPVTGLRQQQAAVTIIPAVPMPTFRGGRWIRGPRP